MCWCSVESASSGWIDVNLLLLVGSVMLQRSVGQVVTTGRPDGLPQHGQRSCVCQRLVGQVLSTRRLDGLLQHVSGLVSVRYWSGRW